MSFQPICKPLGEGIVLCRPRMGDRSSGLQILDTTSKRTYQRLSDIDHDHQALLKTGDEAGAARMERIRQLFVQELGNWP